MTTPADGALYRDQYGTEVQVVGTDAWGVLFKYTRSTDPCLTGEEGTTSIGSFLQRYTEVDVFEAQNPKVKPGDIWWSRRSRSIEVKVMSVLSGVVTYQYLPNVEYSAAEIGSFLGAYTNYVSSPEDTHVWGHEHAYFIVYPSGSGEHEPQIEFVGFNMRYKECDKSGGIVKVPIDWSQAIWEVEPS